VFGVRRYPRPARHGHPLPRVSVGSSQPTRTGGAIRSSP